MESQLGELDISERILELNAKLTRKLLNVMRLITSIEKSGTNTYFNYSYAKESEILLAVREACIESELVITPSMVSMEQIDNGTQNAKGATIFRTRVCMQYTFHDTETGYARSELFHGECLEAEDKGINKAMTAAGKYFLLKAFMIPTVDDPDAAGGQSGNRSAKAEPKQNARQPKAAAAKPATPSNEELAEQMKAAGKFLTDGLGMTKEEFEQFKKNCEGKKRTWIQIALEARDHKVVDKSKLLPSEPEVIEHSLNGNSQKEPPATPQEIGEICEELKLGPIHKKALLARNDLPCARLLLSNLKYIMYFDTGKDVAHWLAEHPKYPNQKHFEVKQGAS
jgi:transposase-like protein